jgi:hypothetical protein
VLGDINPTKLASERGFHSIPELSTILEFGLSVSGYLKCSLYVLVIILSI